MNAGDGTPAPPELGALPVAGSMRAYTNPVHRMKMVNRAALRTTVHRTWEGAYKFSEEQVIHIEGQDDLHVLPYHRDDWGVKSSLISFAREATRGRLEVLTEPDTTEKGETPMLEGIDVLPGKSSADVIVRWRVPGQGGRRVVEMYRYSGGRIAAVARSNFNLMPAGDGRTMWWSEDRGDATPATPAPRK